MNFMQAMAVEDRAPRKTLTHTGSDLDPQAKLDAAFSDLLREIAAGAEYPDAHWRVAHRHRVPGEALQEMYDAHHE